MDDRRGYNVAYFILRRFGHRLGVDKLGLLHIHIAESNGDSRSGKGAATKPRLFFNKDTGTMSRRKTKPKTQAEDDGLNFDVGDIGIETPDFDTALFDILEDEVGEETRYIKPKVYATSSDFVMYDNAVKLARDIEITEGSRYDVVVNGSFIFGDFLEAFIVRNNAKCKKLTISTLSLNQNNVDSLHNLITHGYIDELNLIVSAYFYNMEIRALIPYIYRQLDIDNRLQLAVANVHTKTAQLETLGGKKIIAHGSANLRSSGSIE